VRIAERSGVRIVAGDPARELEVFYRLHLRTRRRLGVPTQPRRFFDLLLERVLKPGLGFMLSAYVGDTPVAAAVFGCWNGTAIYKYSARDERFAKLNANYLLLWTAIQAASERGCHTFDLGRSDEDQADLRGFKNGWGAREEPLTYSFVATTPVTLSSGAANRALSMVIRNSAPWVCRTVGELFYKYAA
jgi:lipid II:glycine glycyltransferase (peptidoglycan interpeptide bridge formation enzyme)